HAGAAHGVEIEFGVAEQALEDGARPDLGRVRRRRRTPGNAVRVGAAIAVVAITTLNAILASELEGRESRRGSNRIRHDLIDRNGRSDFFSQSFSWEASGEIRRGGPPMVPGTLALCGGTLVCQPAEQEDIVAVRDEGLQHAGKRLGQRCNVALNLREPGV